MQDEVCEKLVVFIIKVGRIGGRLIVELLKWVIWKYFF